MDSSKTVTIGERQFKIGRFRAVVGARILNVLMSATLRAQTEDKPSDSAEAKEFTALSEEEKANISIASMWVLVGATISAELYGEIQKSCLQVCFFMKQEDASIPIIMSNGRWAVPEIEKDIPTVNELIVQCLQFNLAPFFIASASKAVEAAALKQ